MSLAAIRQWSSIHYRSRSCDHANLYANICMPDLIYPDMSYKLCGLSYEIHNTIGSVYSEKQYQEAFESKLKFEKIK